MKRLLFSLLIISFWLSANSQNITTKFIRSGYLTEKPYSRTNSTCEFKKRKEVDVISSLGNDWWKVNYNGCIGFVTTPYIELTDDLVKLRELKLQEYQNEIDQERIEENRVKLNAIRIKDSLKIVKLEKDKLIKRQKDSIAKAFEKKVKIAREKIEIEEARKLKMYQSKYTLQNKEECCDYVVNEIDEFTNKRKIRTNYFNFSGHPGYDEPSIEFVRIGTLKYVIFDANRDLGCASSYSTSKSYVKVKLENGVIVTFEHFGDIDCKDNFRLYGKLKESDIYKLKRSPVKIIRMSGTEYSHDFKEIFINKLDCIK